jgi:cysteine desulfurase
MIYLDHAATTKTAPEVVEAMLPYLTEHYGNPGALNSSGFRGKKALNEARRQIAAAINAKPQEIYFTAGGTESDNWALKAAAESCREQGRHIITTKIEHHAVLHTCRYLEENGYEITYLDVDGEGRLDPQVVRAAIRPDTVLISVMLANNEIGTIEPVEEIGAIARQKGICFHTDAVQALGQIPVDVETLKADLLSASAHKLNGPKGVGMLYIREGIPIVPFVHGGAQEQNRRAGTENVPGIVGFGAAVQRACGRLSDKIRKEQGLRDYLIREIETRIPDCRLNGPRDRRLPGNVNFSFPFIRGEAIVISLDMQGICASSGSACTAGSQDPSHVLLAIGLSEEEAFGSVRLTLSEENTKEELDWAVAALKQITARLREMSPAYENYKKEKKLQREGRKENWAERCDTGC